MNDIFPILVLNQHTECDPKPFIIFCKSFPFLVIRFITSFKFCGNINSNMLFYKLLRILGILALI